jgi:hypothetical protein
MNAKVTFYLKSGSSVSMVSETEAGATLQDITEGFYDTMREFADCKNGHFRLDTMVLDVKAIEAITVEKAV